MIYGNNHLMMLALVSASDPMYAQHALLNVIDVAFTEGVDFDRETVMDVIAQSIAFGYAIVTTEEIDQEEILRRFREQIDNLPGDDDEGD